MRCVPRWALAPILINACYYGYLSVALPIYLATTISLDKLGIAIFFTGNATVATILNLAVIPIVRRMRYPRWLLILICMIAAIGLAGIPATRGHGILICLAGAGTVFMTMAFPLYIGMVSNSVGGDKHVIAVIRQIYVVAFMSGLGLFSLVSFSAIPVPGVGVALALIAAAASIPRARNPEKQNSEKGAADVELEGADAIRASPLTILSLAISAVLLMKAADALRAIYLPVVALRSGLPPSLVPALFVITTVVEFISFRPLARLSDRTGTCAALTGVASIGAASFLLICAFPGSGSLFASQALYAIFAAGFQSLGMVLLGQSLLSGTEGGAAVYTAVIQLGSVVGAISPLLIQGFSRSIFYIAATLCALAGCFLAQLWRTSRKVPVTP